MSKKYLFFGFVLVILIIAGFVLNRFFSVKPVQSAAGDNVSGWAWSETIGWINFNGSNYGVNIDINNGKFSGYAWSENIGWISFNESDTGAPPSDDPCADASCIAKATPSGQLGKSNVNIEGWARALAYGGGWDGWLRFDHGQSGEPYIDTDGNWHGWAWGSDVVGWISFNCVDRGVCGTSDYKVILAASAFNSPPDVEGYLETWECCVDSRNPTLYWNYSDPDGDPQESHWVQIDNNKNFSSPEIDTGVVDSSSDSYHPTGQILQWGETYYWHVKKKDNQGNWSDWSKRRDFTIPDHAYPNVGFSWSPSEPEALEPVQFIDQSTCYDDDIDGSPCSDPNDSFKWTIPKTQYADPLVVFVENPAATFSAAGAWDVTLEVTDSDGFTCTAYETVNVSEFLPKWEEIAPR